MSKPKITILLPTRGRREQLSTSLLGLLDKASDLSRVEVLLGLDKDDQETIDYIHHILSPELERRKVNVKASMFEPLGYKNLHIYVNTLAAGATGDWLFFWNDDALMQSEGWDDVIARYTGQFKLLGPKDNHNGHPYAIFPIVPKDWLILMDHLSQNAQNDAWLSQIAYMLDIFERIDVDVIHDRADITGNNNDETFKAREYQEGNPSDPNDFGHVNMKNARVATAKKIAWYLDKIGEDTTFWQNVLAGKQNPFEKMVAAPGVKGAGQLAAIGGTTTGNNDVHDGADHEYPDDYKIKL